MKWSNLKKQSKKTQCFLFWLEIVELTHLLIATDGRVCWKKCWQWQWCWFLHQTALIYINCVLMIFMVKTWICRQYSVNSISSCSGEYCLYKYLTLNKDGQDLVLNKSIIGSQSWGWNMVWKRVFNTAAILQSVISDQFSSMLFFSYITWLFDLHLQVS